MLYWIVPLVFALIALVIIVVLMIRKIPQLRALNVEETLEEKLRRKKEDLVLERLKRISDSRFGRLTSKVGSIFKGAMKFGRKTVHRLKDLEEYYQELKESNEGVRKTDPEVVKRLLGEAGSLEKEEKYAAAEKKYVEIISHNPKHVEAYEELGHLYMKTKQMDQAKETFGFILNLHSDDASVLAAMGEISLGENEHEQALGYFEKAVAKRPGNPKYLDFMIEAALRSKKLSTARQGIDRLREVNPENSKLDEFEARFGEQSVTPDKEEESLQDQ